MYSLINPVYEMIPKEWCRLQFIAEITSRNESNMILQEITHGEASTRLGILAGALRANPTQNLIPWIGINRVGIESSFFSLLPPFSMNPSLRL
jgi:hypothetical protein